MARKLYVILLTLHPAQFRRRFALEMLAIFDEASAQGSKLPLLADGVLSLMRQWVYPHRPMVAAPAPDDAGIPVFYSLDTSLPKQRCIVMGAVLSLVVFSALAIMNGRDEWSARILTAAFESQPNILRLDRESIEPSALTTEFSFGALDCDGDGMLSTAKMANAPVVLPGRGLRSGCGGGR